MVDLKTRPFYLSDDELAWVEKTIAGMTLEEKVGQLFIALDNQTPREEMQTLLEARHIGGCRYFNKPAAEVWEQNCFYQQHARIPVLIAANCDSGGDGACDDGTHVAAAAACGACATMEDSYNTGLVSGAEANALGCNWLFGPVCDILLNWRNTIVNTRAYSNDTELVIRNALAYMRGAKQSGMAVCAKHFPGDGVEELDQHLVTGINSLSCEEWDKTYGRVYKAMIDAGVQSIMVGHIAQPAYSRRLRPGIADGDIMPATLAPELMQELLRGKLGFNGLIVTDASHMVGMTCACPRSRQVTGAIAAGADMFLYFRNVDEDFDYMLRGCQDGTITPQRLDDALHRILGLKASLGLHRRQAEGTLLPPRGKLRIVGCREHEHLAELAARHSITLVKDTAHNLPITPQSHTRLAVYVVSSAPKNRNYTPDPTREVIREELTAAGFDVTMQPDFFELEREYPGDPLNQVRMMRYEKTGDFTARYDAVLLFVHMQGYAQENTMRIRWSAGHSNETPWYVSELPTVAISLNYTTHLLDLPMMRTYINAYGATRTIIRAVIRKLAGQEPFEGIYNETVFCDRWDTRR